MPTVTSFWDETPPCPLCPLPGSHQPAIGFLKPWRGSTVIVTTISSRMVHSDQSENESCRRGVCIRTPSQYVEGYSSLFGQRLRCLFSRS